jgi:zinc transport system ATP-binding protein
MKSVILEVEKLYISFDKNKVISNLSFIVNKGEIVAVVGPNGAGKSVLFKALIGLIPYKGKIDWKSNLKISYVPQKFIVEKEFPLTVKEFMKLKSKNQTTIMSCLEDVGLKTKKDTGNKNIKDNNTENYLLDQKMGWVSGGQLQRILIAWALLDTPDVLLFDEPTSGIDIGGEETIYNLLKKLNEQKKLTILFISHDLNVVYKYANNVLCINKEKLCYGPPKEVLDPQALAKLYGEEMGFFKHEHKQN